MLTDTSDSYFAQAVPYKLCFAIPFSSALDCHGKSERGQAMGVYFTLVLHCMARGEGGVTYESVLSCKSSEKHQAYILYHHKFFGDYKHFFKNAF